VGRPGTLSGNVGVAFRSCRVWSAMRTRGRRRRRAPQAGTAAGWWGSLSRLCVPDEPPLASAGRPASALEASDRAVELDLAEHGPRADWSTRTPTRSKRSATASSLAASCACAATMAAWRRSSAGGSIAWPAARSPRPAATAAAATRCAAPATNRRGATRQTAARDRRAPGPRLLSCAGGTRGGWTPLALRRMNRGRGGCVGVAGYGLVDLVVTSVARPLASDYHRRRLRAPALVAAATAALPRVPR
jgi:hypothetical protein